MEHVLEEFKQFLLKYRSDWNSGDVALTMSHYSRDIQVRWADSESIINDWDYDGAEQGWKQAYALYKGRNPEWHFEDVITEVNAAQEVMTVFYVRFKVDGKMLPQRKLFVETFRREQGQWKKIREYVEVGVKEEEKPDVTYI
ncbi:hypothetical protein ACFSCX_16580 [Bacillus salitolerans]|uniref:DUF4440 domain-containing protein n=1 Tax=Bacillus salitolerans TaxID=1437434 RepID=A0ABW4LVJ0_9BACI